VVEEWKHRKKKRAKRPYRAVGSTLTPVSFVTDITLQQGSLLGDIPAVTKDVGGQHRSDENGGLAGSLGEECAVSKEFISLPVDAAELRRRLDRLNNKTRMSFINLFCSISSSGMQQRTLLAVRQRGSVSIMKAIKPSLLIELKILQRVLTFGHPRLPPPTETLRSHISGLVQVNIVKIYH
jgi:hypothetical protein